MQSREHQPGALVRIVVADDFPEIFDAVEKCLVHTCEVVDRVPDGLALVDSVSRTTFDLIVSDISMPKMSGIEAVRKLRSLGFQTPVVILTVYDDEDLAREAFSVGAQAFVVKSRIGSDLQLAVHEVLAGRTFRSEISRRTDLVR